MDRKDVGILAMDIYFPPTCVQQVKLFSSSPPVACSALPIHVVDVQALLRPVWV
jgi:hypothetical protein